MDTHADSIHIVDTGSVPNLLVLAGRTWQWHTLQPDGHVGPAGGRATLDLYEAFFQPAGVFAWDFGYRVLSRRASKYAVAEQSVEEREFAWLGSPQLSQRTVWKSFWVHGSIYVTWSALESAGPPEVWVGGLARLDRDERLIPVGEPFIRYVHRNPQGRSLSLTTGAWDEESGAFLIDEHEDSLYFRVSRVHKVALDGTVLGVEPVVGDAPYLDSWVKLKNGLWAGVHGTYWLWFTPTERWRDPARQGILPSVGFTALTTQGRDADGTLWLAGWQHDEIIVRRWDEDSQRLSEPMASPLPVKTCALLLSIY